MQFSFRQATQEPSIMPDHNVFIPEIDRYCDRWCERCAFTSHCRHYHIERQSGPDAALDKPDVFNAAFWIELDEQLSVLLKGIAEEEPGRSSASPVPSPHQSAREHPCAKAALHYAGMIDGWKDSGKIWPLFPGEAGEIIRHYHCFLYPKLVRAIEVGMTTNSGHDNPEEAGERAEGTAKTVLIAIDRSLAAWGMVYREYPEYEDAALDMLLHLDRLRKSVEALFPGSRSFRRPGLDD